MKISCPEVLQNKGMNQRLTGSYQSKVTLMLICNSMRLSIPSKGAARTKTSTIRYRISMRSASQKKEALLPNPGAMPLPIVYLQFFLVTLTLGIHHSGRQSEFREDNLLNNNPNGDYCSKCKEIIHRHPLSFSLRRAAFSPWLPQERPFPSSALPASSPLLPFCPQQGFRLLPARRQICRPSVRHSQ